MILEHAVLHVRPGLADEFRAAFARASLIIEASPGFRSLRLLPCIEDEDRFLLLVKWERLEDHIEVFRGSAAYDDWKALLHRFYEPFPEVDHYSLSD